MVRTSKGPAESEELTKAPTGAEAPKRESVRPKDIDDATWAQIESMARSQSVSTGEVITRAIVNQYGVAAVTGAYHSGMDSDPSKA